MYGDMFYCTNCKKTFKDTWKMRDTRTENIQIICPFCMSSDTMNASKFIEEFEGMSNREKNCKYYTNAELLNINKRFYKLLKKKNMIFKAKMRLKNVGNKSC